MIRERTRAIFPIRRALPAIRAIPPRMKGRRAANFIFNRSRIGIMSLPFFFFLSPPPPCPPPPCLPLSSSSSSSSIALPALLRAFITSTPFKSIFRVWVERKFSILEAIIVSTSPVTGMARGAPSPLLVMGRVFTTVTPSNRLMLSLVNILSTKVNSLSFKQE
uniref:Uncharacterized protein n=1 Tax=Cacopsylla melanoneura TaxID=428564 RepID=A0A8D8QPY5_9HEMI